MTTSGEKNAKGKNAGRKKSRKPLTPVDRFKIEVAKELGLWDKVKQVGWAGLSAAETGQIGGWMTRKMKKKKLNNLDEYAATRLKRKKRQLSK